MENNKQTKTIYAIKIDLSKNQEQYNNLMDDSDFHCDAFPTPYVWNEKYFESLKDASDYIEWVEKAWKKKQNEEEMTWEEEFAYPPECYSIVDVEVILDSKKK